MKFAVVVIATLLALPLSGMAQSSELTSRIDSVSYMLGANMAQGMSRDGLDLNPDLIYQGMLDVFSGDGSKIDQQTAQALMMAFQQELMAKQQANMQAQGEENMAKAQEFLTQNAEKEGIIVTESGLQYEVLEPGEGPKPTPQNTVVVHYEGRLLNGDVFDSSYQRGQPATFGVTQVIQGWIEGLQLMSPGSKYRFFIPPNLAYGPRGSQPNIGPNEALIFDVELIEIR